MQRREFLKGLLAATPLAAGCAGPAAAGRPAARALRGYAFDQGARSLTLNAALAAPLRFWVVTDSHLKLRDARDDRYRENYRRMSWERTPDFTVRMAFDQTMKRLAEAKEKPDLLIVPGDAISFPSLLNVEYLKAELDRTGIPWLYVAGNHDWHFEGLPGKDEALRAEWIEKRLLPLYQGEDPLGYSRVVKGVRFVMLDDTTYNITRKQLDFFRAEVAKGDPTVLVMHIPFWHEGWPVYMLACPRWGRAVDTIYRIEGREPWPERQAEESFALRREVEAADNLLAVIAGHMHGWQVAEDAGRLLVTVSGGLKGDYLQVTVC